MRAVFGWIGFVVVGWASLPTLACSVAPASSEEDTSTSDLTPAAATVTLPDAPAPAPANAQSSAPNEPAPTPDPSCTPARFTCAADGLSRTDGCATETCARGCYRGDGKADDVCLGAAGTNAWSCTGSYGTKKSTDGDHFITAFGCWKDASGVAHGDGQDNCIPSCFAQAKAAGLCLPGDTGKNCEERVTWYTADAARFGCLARVRVTNPANGKSVVAVALDYGPSCSVESRQSKAVLDASGRVNRELFGTDHGVDDRALVHVVEVDKSTPLGPQ